MYVHRHRDVLSEPSPFSLSPKVGLLRVMGSGVAFASLSRASSRSSDRFDECFGRSGDQGVGGQEEEEDWREGRAVKEKREAKEAAAKAEREDTEEATRTRLPSSCIPPVSLAERS